MVSLFLIMNDVRSISSEWFKGETEIIRELGKPLLPLWRVSAKCFAYLKETRRLFRRIPVLLGHISSWRASSQRPYRTISGLASQHIHYSLYESLACGVQ